MKKTTVLFTAAILVAGFSLNAQQPMKKANEKNPQMMHMQMGDMPMGDMPMGNMQMMNKCPMCGKMTPAKMPMQKYMMLVNHLPDMQMKLSLSDEQTHKLIDMRAAYKKQLIDLQADLTKNQMMMNKLLNDKAPANKVESQMKACSDTKIAMKMAAYKTAMQMKDLLTEKQKEQMQQMQSMHQNMMKKNVNNNN